MNPRNEMLKDLEVAMDLMSEGRPETAMVPLWRIHKRLRESALQPSAPVFTPSMDDIYGAPTKKLPPMKPIRKQKKRVRPLDVECPTCGAQPGQQCFRMTKRGTGGTPIVGEYVNHSHNPRINRARTL